MARPVITAIGGVNFFVVDEHLESTQLRFADLTRQLKTDYGLKTVLDVVCNHGSPSFTMPADQPKFGEIYDADGVLVADHENVVPQDLDYDNPLHRFFHKEQDLAELSNINDTNPAVLEYFVAAYLQWIEQGADAFRIDTIRHMPHTYWKSFSDRIRAEHPGFFMFGESFDFNASTIAEHTYPENGGISVLDFPGKQAMGEVFAEGQGFERLLDYLHLTDGVYQNPYDQMTFYDNHDMPRMDATPGGFIDAHNWLFTSRGIPVVYYGSEIGFRAGLADTGEIAIILASPMLNWRRPIPCVITCPPVAHVRKGSIALQRGLQANLSFDGDTAVFYRVYQRAGQVQTALVLLNKGDVAKDMLVQRWLSAGNWRDAMSGERVFVDPANPGNRCHGAGARCACVPVGRTCYQRRAGRRIAAIAAGRKTPELVSRHVFPAAAAGLPHDQAWSDYLRLDGFALDEPDNLVHHQFAG